MALSNWDCIAFTDKGEPSNGIYISPIGIKVEIYKNWIFVADEAVWQGGGFAKPYIIRIHGGIIHYRDINIVSRFIDGAIYLIVWSEDNDENLSGMIGIGGSGFGRNGRYYGIRKKQVRLLHKIICDDDIPAMIPSEFRKINLSKGKRFNQGDNFFTKNAGVPDQSTPVGDAKEPLLIKMLRG